MAWRGGLPGVEERGERARVRSGTWEAPLSPWNRCRRGNRRTKGPGSRPQAPATVRANDGRQPRYRRAKATKRGGKEGRESERPGSTDEAGEPTRGTPWREGGAGDTELLEGKTTEPPTSDTVSTRLQRIAGLAREDPERAFRSLAHYIDLELLHEAFRRTRKDGATGVDGQTGSEHESHPDAGTPQGGVVSPLLANIYLHEVLDQSFERDVKARLTSRAFMVRFA